MQCMCEFKAERIDNLSRAEFQCVGRQFPEATVKTTSTRLNTYAVPTLPAKAKQDLSKQGIFKNPSVDVVDKLSCGINQRRLLGLTIDTPTFF